MSGSFTTLYSGADFTQAYTVSASTLEYPNPPFAVGLTAPGMGSSEWLFVKVAASQTIVAGDFVYVSSTDNTFVVTSLANAAKALFGSFVGVAGASVTTTASSNSWIWIQRKGFNAAANIVTAAAANALLRTSATAGRLTGTATGGTTGQVSGVVATVAAAANVAPVMLNYPVISTAD